MASTASLNNIGGYMRNVVAPTRDTVSTTHAFVLSRFQGPMGVDVSPAVGASARTVRRPLGVEFKRDSYAYIEVLRQRTDSQNNTKFEPLLIFNENHPTTFSMSASGITQNAERISLSGRHLSTPAVEGVDFVSGVAAYSNNFLIQGVQDARQEKYQIIETFGDNFLFLFGERPRILEVQGMLLNTNSHRWKREWWLNYDRFLRGTRAVENRAIVTLHCDDVAISGYILSATSTDSADNPRRTPFSFTMIVTDYVFEDEPIDTMRFFGANLYKNQKPEGGNVGVNSLDEALGKAADVIRTGLDAVNSAGSNSIVKAMVASISGAAFGNPLSTITNGVAMGMQFADSWMAATGGLGNLEPFKTSLGSLVEFQGQPVDLYPVSGAPGAFGSMTTLRERGQTALVAAVDNSLSILLNAHRSPVVQMVSMIGDVIDGALRLFGVSGTDMSSKYRDLVASTSRNTAAMEVRFMGMDLIVPFGGKAFEIKSPASAAQVLPEGFVNAAAMEVVTGSGVDLQALKASPQYEILPRSWRLAAERRPQEFAAKVLAVSSRDADDGLELNVWSQSVFPVVKSQALEKI